MFPSPVHMLGRGGIALSKEPSMLQNTLLLSVASLAMRAVSMLFQVYLSGQVGAVGLGLMQLTMTINGFAVTLGSSGLRVAAMYLSAEEYGAGRMQGARQAMRWCLGIGTALSALVGGAMTLSAEALAVAWVRDVRAVPALRLLGLTLPLTCLGGILGGYFTACGQVRRLVAVELAERVASVVCTAWLLGRGETDDLAHACAAIVGGSALAALGAVAVLLILMARSLRGAGPSVPGMGRRLVRFCVPVALNDYLRSGLGTLEQLLIPYGLTRYGGSQTGALADYGIIHGMVFPVLFFPNTVLLAVSDLLVPKLARCRARRETERTQAMVRACLRAGVLFSCAVTGLVYVLAEPLGLALYHSVDAGRYLRLFAPLIPMLYLDCIVDGMHKGLGQQLYCVRVNTLTNLLDVLLLFALLPRYGIGGYLFTYTLTHGVNFFLSLRRLLTITGVEPGWRFPAGAGFSLCASAAASVLLIPRAGHWAGALIRGGMQLTLFSLLLGATGCLDRKMPPR